MTTHFKPDWQAALTLQDQGQAREALQHFRAIGACQVKAGELPGVLETARRLCLLYDTGTALRLLQEASHSAATPPAILMKIALLLRQENLFPEAAGYAVRVLQGGTHDGAALDARLILAECLERQGLLSESLACAEEVLRSRPGSIPAHRQRATVLRRRGLLDEACSCLADLVKFGAPPHWETCRAWFELGQIQDARRDYAAAWHAWTQARKHYPRGADWNLFRQQATHIWQQARSLHESITPAQLGRWTAGRDAAPPRHTILTGHPRSGTTLIGQALKAHSGIVSMEETTIFPSAVCRPLFQHGPPGQTPAQRLDSLTPTDLDHWNGEYHALTDLALRGRPRPALLLDKNPGLLQLLPAAARLMPESRFIVMVRDPRDILVSMFAQALPPNDTSWSYRHVQSTAEMIALRLGLWLKLREQLPPGCFHEIRYESAVGAFSSTMESTLEFLGLPHERLVSVQSAPSRLRQAASPSHAAVPEPVHAQEVGQWQHYAAWISPALPILQSTVSALGYAD